MAEPVFLHGWWRTSSTFFWQAFRQLPEVAAYYEPFHQFFTLRDRGELSSQISRQGVWPGSFHSPIEGGYLTEYAPVLDAADRLPLIPKPVPYDLWFLTPDAEARTAERWLETLIRVAGKRRSVLSFNRSLGRIAWMKRRFDGTHILLWRDPAEHWAALNMLKAVYGKPFFVDAAMLVASKARGEPRFRPLLGAAGPPYLLDGSIGREMRWIGAIADQLDAAQRYEAFVSALTCCLVENLAAADLVVDVSDLAAGRSDPAAAGEAILDLTGLAPDLTGFRNDEVWRREEATQRETVVRVMARLDDVQRQSLVRAIAAQSTRSPRPSHSLGRLARAIGA